MTIVGQIPWGKYVQAITLVMPWRKASACANSTKDVWSLIVTTGKNLESLLCSMNSPLDVADMRARVRLGLLSRPLSW